MAIKTIITEPSEILRQKSKLVDIVGDEERKLMDDMLDTMYYANGIGLSIIVIFMYYLLIKFGQSLGYNNILNPFLSVWMVNFIFFLIGTHLFIKSRT